MIIFLRSLGFPRDSAGKESVCNTRDMGSIPGLERSPGKGKSYPVQYSGLENSMDYIVHWVAKSWTGLNNFHFHFQKRTTELITQIIQLVIINSLK